MKLGLPNVRRQEKFATLAKPISIARYKIRTVIMEVICDLPDCDMTSDSHFSYWEGFQGDSVEKYNI